MAVAGLVTSPVLLGRDEFLELAQRRLASAAEGRGELLLVAGEAGIGKTRFLNTVSQQARTQGFTVISAAAFPGDTESSAGLLLDLAGALTGSGDLDQAELGRRLSARVRAVTVGSGRAGGSAGDLAGDAHHRRRRLAQDLAGLLLNQRGGGPQLIVLEDLHWADAVSLDVLGRLAPRLDRLPLLIAAAYRSDELFPARPLRELRNRLVAQRLAEEIRLPRLGLSEISALAGAVLGATAASRVVQALHERSDGIPLHAEELLAALGPEASVLGLAVPQTLADAVLSRAGQLTPATRHVVRAAAVIGRSFDFDVLTTVSGGDPDTVAAALRELRAAHLVLPGADETTFDFRHALIRDALYADTDLPERRRLHERAAEVALARGLRSAVVSAHFEQAALLERAYQHALIAAEEATSMSAHREALELYRRALRCAAGDLAPGARVALLAAVADEEAAGDENVQAAATYQSAHALALEIGDVVAAAGLVPRMVAVRHLLGAPLSERIAGLRAAVQMLDEAGVAAEAERAALHAGMTAAYMLDRRLDEAIAEGRQAQAADQDVALNTAATLGSVLVFAGRPDPGWELLEGCVRQARAARRETEAARAYRMLASTASVVVEYERADRWLAEGIRYAEGVELWNHRHYLAAHQAHVHWARGHWDSAAAQAQQALADGRGGITTRITAQYVLGYLAVGRGDWDRAGAVLQEAYEAGRGMSELQRFSPPLWGLAEMARCRGEYGEAARLCEAGFRASDQVSDAAYLFPFLLTGVRAYLGAGDPAAAADFAGLVAGVLRARSIPGTLPALVHAQGLLQAASGELDEARSSLESAVWAWAQRGRFWENGWGLIDLAGLALRRRRRAEAENCLGEVRVRAAAVGASVLVKAAADVVAVSPRPLWHPLTAREFEVAGLVADGLTNRQIAERLVLAPKTVSAHVEHILAKLGVARRTEIAAWAAGIR